MRGSSGSIKSKVAALKAKSRREKHPCGLFPAWTFPTAFSLLPPPLPGVAKPTEREKKNIFLFLKKSLLEFFFGIIPEVPNILCHLLGSGLIPAVPIPWRGQEAQDASIRDVFSRISLQRGSGCNSRGFFFFFWSPSALGVSPTRPGQAGTSPASLSSPPSPSLLSPCVFLANSLAFEIQMLPWPFPHPPQEYLPFHLKIINK